MADCRPVRIDLDRVAAYEPAVAVDGVDEQAAVLVPVVRRADGDVLLFTERHAALRSHPGEMSFPGGAREPEDTDLEATALREATEEVGLLPGETDVVGRLDDLPPFLRFGVRPFVARVPDRTYAPASGEVARVVLYPVAAFCDPANFESELREGDEETYRLHFFRVDGDVVWGLTARVVVNLLEVAADWELPPPDRVLDADADLPDFV